MLQLTFNPGLTLTGFRTTQQSLYFFPLVNPHPPPPCRTLKLFERSPLGSMDRKLLIRFQSEITLFNFFSVVWMLTWITTIVFI